MHFSLFIIMMSQKKKTGGIHYEYFGSKSIEKSIYYTFWH